MLENSKLYCYLFIYYFPSDKFEDPTNVMLQQRLQQINSLLTIQIGHILVDNKNLNINC
jgi:hypothetical protein